MKKNIFIILYLFIQIALPAKYYFSDNKFDERFAWRMFSPERMVKCNVQFYHDINNRRYEVNAYQDIHYAWVSLMLRGKLAVVDEYSRYKCSKMPSNRKNLYVNLSCPYPDGTIYKLIPDDKNLCL